jgi:hypothetical protein
MTRPTTILTAIALAAVLAGGTGAFARDHDHDEGHATGEHQAEAKDSRATNQPAEDGAYDQDEGAACTSPNATLDKDGRRIPC